MLVGVDLAGAGVRVTCESRGRATGARAFGTLTPNRQICHEDAADAAIPILRSGADSRLGIG